MISNILKINSVDVTSKISSFQIEENWGESVSEMNIEASSKIFDLVTLQVGQTVELWREFATPPTYKRFSGYIDSFSSSGGRITISCSDEMESLVRSEVNYIYDKDIDASAGKISEIFKDLVETYGNLTADGTSVQDSGTDILLDQFVCSYSNVMERCKALASILDWQFYYSADDDKVFFETRGYNSNSQILTVGQEIIGVPTWDRDTSQLVNSINVVGATQNVETTQSGQIGVDSGYATTGIDVTYEPSSVKVYMDSSNPPTTLLVGGVPNTTITYDYYVDKSNKKILPKSGSPFTTNDYAQINYSYSIPRTVPIENTASISAYGAYKKTLTFTDIRSVDDAQSRGQNYLDRYSNPFKIATLKVKISDSYSFSVGDTVRVIDGINRPNIDDYFIITKIRRMYPANYDEITVGGNSWSIDEWQESVETRLKRIEEDKTSNVENPNKLLSVDNASLLPINTVPRYKKVYTDNGGGEVIHWVGHYNDTYEEEFIDNDFKNASTTATWGSGECDF